MHDLVVKLNLSYSGQEFLLSLFVRSLVVEKDVRDALEEDDWVVIVSLIWATEIDSVNQAHISFFNQFDIDQIFNQAQSVGLREFLKDKSCLLLVLVEHLSQEAATHDADNWLNFTILFEEQINFLNV
jgi:hypothetical protein